MRIRGSSRSASARHWAPEEPLQWSRMTGSPRPRSANSMCRPGRSRVGMRGRASALGGEFGQALARPGEQHRDPLAIEAIAVAELGDEIALLEPDAEED